MNEVYIVGGVRTAIGNFGGSLRNVKSRALASMVIGEAIRRSGIDANQVQEVIMGEVRQSTEAGNMARVAALAAGIPESVPAYTVNRLCASSLQALNCGFQEIRLGEVEVAVVGGAENMSQAPFYIRGGRFGDVAPNFVDSNAEAGPNSQPTEIYGANLSMGITAENVAQQFQISREDQDLFALTSQQRAARAIAEQTFVPEIMPVEIKGKKGVSSLFAVDEFPRLGVTAEALAKLKPVFKTDGTVTAGNACGRSDGAAALVLMSKARVEELGVKPLARIVGIAAVGVSPTVMGIGPVPAVNAVLAKTGLSLADIDLVELNEAFAAQALACIRELGLDSERVNVNGGAIALGHPMGGTGARLVVTLLHELIRRKARYGLATLCIGGGQGMAAIIETM